MTKLKKRYRPWMDQYSANQKNFSGYVVSRYWSLHLYICRCAPVKSVLNLTNLCCFNLHFRPPHMYSKRQVSNKYTRCSNSKDPTGSASPIPLINRLRLNKSVNPHLLFRSCFNITILSKKNSMWRSGSQKTANRC